MLSWEASVSPIVDQLEEAEDPRADDFEEDDEKDLDDEDDELEAEYEEYEEEFTHDDQPKHGRRLEEWD